jgi:hypothetical protein
MNEINVPTLNSLKATSAKERGTCISVREVQAWLAPLCLHSCVQQWQSVIRVHILNVLRTGFFLRQNHQCHCGLGWQQIPGAFLPTVFPESSALINS